MNSGVYAIISPSGKRYIGSALDFAVRWRKHKRDLKAGRHHSPALQHAANKYGLDALRFEVIAYVARESLIVREQAEIDAYGMANLYNVCPKAANCEGRFHKAESREKVAKAKRGKPRPPFSAEWLANMSAAVRQRVRTPEHNAAIAAALTGRVVAQSTCDAISRGKRESDKTAGQIAALADAKRGRKAARNTTGFYGVYATKDGRWTAYAYLDGKRTYLGRYTSPEAASQAVQSVTP